MTRARNLGGIAATTYISADGGNIGIGTTIPTSKLQVVGNVNVSGVTTLGNTVVGGGTTQLIVRGDARVTGILTVGQSSITLDGSDNRVNVGTGVTIHHTDGVQVGGNTVHSSGLTVNQVNVSGFATATEYDIIGSSNTFNAGGLNVGVATATTVRVGSAVTINSSGVDASPGTIKGGTGCVTGTLTSGTKCVTGTLTAATANIPGTVTGGVLCATSCVSAAAANIPGTVTAGGFSGPGSGLSNIPSGAITGGISALDVCTFNSSGTWTKPTSAKYVLVEMISGGGGGGGGTSTPCTIPCVSFGAFSCLFLPCGLGGCGGKYINKLFPAPSLSSTISITIGAGGAAGVVNNCIPCPGGNSCFGTLFCTVNGSCINNGGTAGATIGGQAGCGHTPGFPGGGILGYTFCTPLGCACSIATTGPSINGNDSYYYYEWTPSPGSTLSSLSGVSAPPGSFGGGSGGGVCGTVSYPTCYYGGPGGAYPVVFGFTGNSGSGGNGGIGGGGGGGGTRCPGGSGGNGRVIVYTWS